MTHTPTPWEYEVGAGKGAWIKGSDGQWAAMSCGESQVNAENNAALIVEAVNSHASLISRVEKMEKALQDIADDASVPQQMYDRNGPQWTSPQGNEYEDTSAFLAKCNELADMARAALQTQETE